MDTSKDIQKRNIMMKLMKISIERQFNCGDGSGEPITSHSFRCRCDELNKQELELNKELEGLEKEGK